MTDEHPATSRRVLLEQQYAGSANLDARVAIYAYAVRKGIDEDGRSLQEKVASMIPGGVAGRRVLDVGCGPGGYVEPMRGASLNVGLDLSVGMLAESRRRNGDLVQVTNADAEHLPVRDASFDVVLAMHMLYHVPDRAKAIDELARVVRDDGVVMVVTNASDHQHQTDALVSAAHREVTGEALDQARAASLFPLEAAPGELGRRFDVEVHSHGGELEVPHADPVVAYIASMRTLIGITDDERWAQLLEVVRRRAEDVIAAEGTFRITGSGGVLVCRPR
jgi:SAM-dependent methyltransferase